MARDHVRPQGVDERLWSKVIINEATGCWEWQGATTNGYGAAWSGGGRGIGRVRMAHRLFYELIVGDVGDAVLDHLCRNRRCVNPEHLEPTTHQVNILRGVGATAANAAKTHCPQGHTYADHAYVKSGRRICGICSPTTGKQGQQRTWTSCIHDHEFTAENTYIRPNGSRACRTCRVERKRRYRAEGRMR